MTTAKKPGISPEQLSSLSAPTDPAEIKTRPGRGNSGPLSYVDARYVMERLDAIGPGNWQRRHSLGSDGKVSCDIGILIDGEWVWKGDGAGETDIEGEKGAFSDAFKRAAVNWGIGRDLYGPRPVAAPVATRPAIVPDSLKIKIRATARERGLGDDQLKLFSIHLTGKDSSKNWTLSDADMILATLEDPDKQGTVGMFADAGENTSGLNPRDGSLA